MTVSDHNGGTIGDCVDVASIAMSYGVQSSSGLLARCEVRNYDEIHEIKARVHFKPRHALVTAERRCPDVGSHHDRARAYADERSAGLDVVANALQRRAPSEARFCCKPLLARARSAFAVGALQFLSDYAAQNGLDGFPSLLDESSQRVVDQRLIVPSACRVNLATKPFEQIVRVVFERGAQVVPRDVAP